MAIRKRSWLDAKGEARQAWLVDYRDSAGVRRAKQFTRKKDAEVWSTQAAWQVSQGTHTPDSVSITVKKAAEQWIERARRDGLEPTTIAAYDQHVRLHLVPICGDMKLSQLSTPTVEGYRDQLVIICRGRWRYECCDLYRRSLRKRSGADRWPRTWPRASV